MEQKWVCLKCLEKKHKDCESFDKDAGLFCECKVCEARFMRNVAKLNEKKS